MKLVTRRRSAAATGVLCIVLATSCGAQVQPASAPPPSSADALSTPITASPAGSATQAIRVGLVTDSGGLNDKSLNDAVNRGLITAQKNPRITTSVKPAPDDTQAVDAMNGFASAGYDLVFVVGLTGGSLIEGTARQFPSTKFVVIDSSPLNLKEGKFADLPNVLGVIFRNEEVGYLAGIIAAEMAKGRVGKATNNTVCAMSPVHQSLTGPTYEQILNGYREALQANAPTVQVLSAYVAESRPEPDDIDRDIASAEQLGKAQIAQGCDILFAAGGWEAAGYLGAARDAGKYAIGLAPTASNINDQFLAPAIDRPEAKGPVIAVIMRRVDLAVSVIAQAVAAGRWAPGYVVFGVAEDAIGYLALPAVPSEVRAAVDRSIAQIRNGQLKLTAPALHFGP